MSARERLPHPYKECFVPLSDQYGVSQFTPFRTQRSRWHMFPSPIDTGSHDTYSISPCTCHLCFISCDDVTMLYNDVTMLYNDVTMLYDDPI